MQHVVRTGISLIEVLVVIAIIGLMATQLPRLTSAAKTPERQMLSALNSLARNGHLQALMTGKIHQLYFDFEQSQKFFLRVATEKKNLQGDFEFEPAAIDYGDDSYGWSNELEVVRFVIDGTDEAVGGVLKTVWFYVMPDGLAQQVRITVRNKESGMLTDYVLNPLYVQFGMA